MNEKINVAVLGATGSIGRAAAEILSRMPERFSVAGIVGNNNLEELVRQNLLLSPRMTVTADPAKEKALRSRLPSGARAAGGAEPVMELVTDPAVDVVLCAIVGVAGVEPVIAALRAGKRVALASKEVLVMAGEVVMAEARKSPGGGIIPVDSEHSALHQCLAGRDRAEVRKLWLTSSGGPFRTWSGARIAEATPEDALAHPVWNMGVKITIDSASMMNKALELIEAGFLFDVAPEQLGVTVNPSSLVHSFVELADRSIIAQMGTPDMRMPIQYALTSPERCDLPGTGLDFDSVLELRFEPPDRKKFRSIDLAFEAMRRGGTSPAVLNAANDVAVERFLRREIAFPAIWTLVERAMSRFDGHPESDIAAIRALDAEVRRFAAEERP